MASQEFVRIEVHDNGPGFDPPPHVGLPDPKQTGGRGLYLVQALSDRWGVEPAAPTCVWFEVDLQDPAATHSLRWTAQEH